MQNIISQEKVSMLGSLNGINVYLIKAEKFKTNTLNVFFHDNLRSETAAKNALIPAVLRRGCKSLPTFKDIALRLEELYGASFDCGVVKKGERQIIHFYIEYVSDIYADPGANLSEKAFELLFEIMLNPVLENGIFNESYVQQEKENLKRLIESRVNDKNQYAVDRCFEEMCSDEPFGIYEYGSVKDLEPIDGKGLYEYYKSFIESSPIDLYITGSIEEGRLDALMEKLSGIGRGRLKEVGISTVNKDIKEVKNVTDKMDVSQGKLSIGFRTNTSPDSGDYYTLLVYNSILGGGMHSKLFQNVREKESLAYYVFSRLEKFKGLMVISSGIDIQNRDRALEIIKAQMEDIQAGNITDYEFESALKSMETGIKSLKDSQLQIVDFYLGQSIGNTKDNFDSIIENIKKISREDVAGISKKIKMDTVYFLTGK